MSKVGAENSNNEVNDSKKEHKLLRKGLAVALAGAVTLGAAGCSGDKVGATAPEVNPSTTTESVAESQEVPKEAESFIDQYGSLYDDPVSVYFAQKDYETNVSTRAIILSEEYITNYEPSSGLVSDLGFEEGKFPVGSEDINDFVDFFNEYTVPQVSRYMNLLARNPSPEAVKVIDNEFLKYCSANENLGTQVEFTDDDQDILELMDLSKEIVAKYGSAANYRVEKGSLNEGSGGTFFFNPNVSLANRLDSDIQSLHVPGVNIVISVEAYDNNKVSNYTETIKNTQLVLTTHPGVHPVDYNYVSIGVR